MPIDLGSMLLFQGDSITDGGHGRPYDDQNHYLGHGYVYLIAASLQHGQPGLDLRFLNRGIGGHTTADLLARWDADTVAHRPDLLSVLVGINDLWFHFQDGRELDPAKYRAVYRQMLAAARAARPGVRLVLGEPFALPVGPLAPLWPRWRPALAAYQAEVAALAAEVGAVHVPLQARFEAVAGARADRWLWDGVHPTPGGHELIARAWLEAVRP